MKRIVIAGFAAGAAMMIGGALAAVSDVGSVATRMTPPDGDVMNPLIAGQAMLPGRTLLENISLSPEHSMLMAAMRNSGVSDALEAGGEFTVFAPANSAMPAQILGRDKVQLAPPDGLSGGAGEI